MNNFHQHFEIYNPKGLTVWYPKSPETVEFGVAVLLNPSPNSHIHHCYVCLNTTTASYGKFIIHDDNAVIRPKDYLEYQLSFRDSRGRISIEKGEFYVAGNRIFHRQEPCSSTTNTSTTKVELPRAASLQENINLLENIVNDVFHRCNNVTEISKNLYLNFRPAPNLDPRKLYEFTLNELQTMLPTINWNNALVHTFYYNDGVGFEVKNHIDKLKVLKLSRDFNRSAIRDWDDLEQSMNTSDNNEDYNDVFSSDSILP